MAHDRRVTSGTLRLGGAGSKMRSVIGRRSLGAHLLAGAALLAVIIAAGPASAQSASPSPASGPGVNGQVTGALAEGSTLTIGIDGTMPGGWHALHLLEASVMSGDQELDRLRFDIEDNKLTVGDQDTLIVGTGTDVWLPPRGLREALRVVRVVLDPMQTGPAIRTYNIMMGERRRVAAALIAVP